LPPNNCRKLWQLFSARKAHSFAGLDRYLSDMGRVAGPFLQAGKPARGLARDTNIRRVTLAESDRLGANGGTAEAGPGPGHNSGVDSEPAVWERWTKKRTFVRALEGTYGELIHELFSQPRVYHSKDWKWKGGPQNFGKKIVNPGSVKIAQSIEMHLDCFAPGGYGQRHGHMNSAVFYVLKGKGHDVHDRRRLDWEAGDALIVENGCVHQHFNDDPNGEAIVLVAKAKPLFLFMHMIFQKVAAWPPKEPESEAQRNYVPPNDI
jgi:quercetin dioxygenase-like cupin family protein